MAAKPRIAIVGAGSLGAALALALRRAGYPIDTVIARNTGSSKLSLKRARKLAREVKARILTLPLDDLRADVIWFCVPDGEIAHAAKTLSELNWKGKAALHSSGSLSSDALAILRRQGATVAAAHPMMTFVRGSRPLLRGVPFTVEGDAAAVRLAGRIIRDLGGHAYSIRQSDKAAYHAWGTFASPLLTALLVTAEQVAILAGVDRKAARRRMLPILLQTLANYETRAAAEAFSGPIIRGDVETVKKHLDVLGKVPAARKVYVALAAAALEYLPSRNRASLAKVLRLR